MSFDYSQENKDYMSLLCIKMSNKENGKAIFIESNNDNFNFIIEGTAYWYNHSDSSEFLENNNLMKLYITILGITEDAALIPLKRHYAEIPEEIANSFFEFRENITIEDNKNFDRVYIELSCTRKFEGEMGIEESKRVGTFFRTILPVMR